MSSPPLTRRDSHRGGRASRGGGPCCRYRRRRIRGGLVVAPLELIPAAGASLRPGWTRELVPTQAIPLALIASVYPFGLVALLLLFAGPRPRAHSVVFLIGAAVCLLAVGFPFVFVLRGAGLNQTSNSTPRYGLHVALGVVFLVGAWVLAHRPPKPKTAQDQPSWVSRALSRSGLLAVFVVGVALYAPSPTDLAALDAVGSTKMSSAATAAWVVAVAALVLITIEVPILLYFVAPGWTIPKLQALNGWLSRNGHTLLVYGLAVLGVWQVTDGLVGLL